MRNYFRTNLGIMLLLSMAITTGMPGVQKSWAQGPAAKSIRAVVSTPKMISPGKPFILSITVTVDKPYHVQGNPAHEDQIATVAEVGAADGVKVGKITYPKPASAKIGTDTLPIYEGSFVIKAEVTVRKAGAFKLPVTVKYQACNDAACYPPATIKAEASFTAGAAKPSTPNSK